MADVRARLSEYRDAVEGYASAAADTIEADFKALEKGIDKAWSKVKEEAEEARVAIAEDLEIAQEKLAAAYHTGEHDVQVALGKVRTELGEVKDRVEAFIRSI